ncbi:MAG TPA: molybdopterin-dependent oxidoreductase [Candidatus Paenalcaligenes intestinipullorum]|uniref:Molybdopterin-dependent oxidoreductase n=1 Tax=Candidatus Paenalcaligenes intestinipullorum TaxID=2838718 RepID=A0A9D2REE2_9BURK|nr:molybdopterin-dependent oxidoreductase [Candidatus Paenalcaligenes intestinipullorum]
MSTGFNRRDFIKFGTVAGITILVGRVPIAQALQVNSGPSNTDWMGSSGKPNYRWDAIRKVTGQKNFALEFFAKDLDGWPDQQCYAFMLKATDVEHSFEGIDLSSLSKDLQPDTLLLEEDLERDGFNVPQDTDLGKNFYGQNILLPKGTTSPIYGHPVAILIYKNYDRYFLAKQALAFNNSVVKYGAQTGQKTFANYGAGRFVRLGGKTPLDPSIFSPYQDAAIRGGFDGNQVVWPPFEPEHELALPEVIRKDRSGGHLKALHAAKQKPETQPRGMQAVEEITQDLEAAKKNPDKIVLERQGFSQSIDPCAMEPDNCNVWYDTENRTLHILAATQSPVGVINLAAMLAKNSGKYPVDTIVLMTGSTVGYGSKDYSVFPIYALVASFYSGGLAVRIANNRFEQFQMGMKRHSVEMDVTISADRQTGKFEILRGSYTCNGGGRENLSVAVSHVAARGAQSIYYFPKSDLTAVALASTAVEAGSMRGFGSLQSMAVTEIMVDELAHELALDPIELRRRNALLEGYPNTQGGIISGDPRHIEMLDRAAVHPLWQERERAKKDFEAANPGQKYGVGFAQVQQVYGSSGVPSALTLEFDAQGRLSMQHCMQEIGTGGTTAQQVMVWNILGKTPDHVEFGMTDFPQLPLHTSYASQAEQDQLSKNDPYWTPAILPDMSSSSGVYYIGFATRQAAHFLLRYSLWPAAQAIWSAGIGGGSMAGLDVRFEDLRIGPQGVGGGGMTPIPFERLAAKAHELGLITGVAAHSYSAWEWSRAEFEVPTVGKINIPLDAIAVKYGDGAGESLKNRMTVAGYDFIKREQAYYPPTQRGAAGPTTYSPAACIVALSVTPETGAVKVLNHHMLMDAGTLVVPELVSGQIQGGTAMGIGHALMEFMPLYEGGPGMGDWNFSNYNVPRAADVAVWNQSVDYLPPLSETSPPKGMAELGMVPILPAISNAVSHALGQTHRFYDFPITPDKIKKALA